jgi:hypothetical protein
MVVAYVLLASCPKQESSPMGDFFVDSFKVRTLSQVSISSTQGRNMNVRIVDAR